MAGAALAFDLAAVDAVQTGDIAHGREKTRRYTPGNDMNTVGRRTQAIDQTETIQHANALRSLNLMSQSAHDAGCTQHCCTGR